MVCTFDQFLEYLSPKVKEKYLNNLREYRLTERDFNHFVNQSLRLYDWTSYAFLWCSTSEGQRYWEEVATKMKQIQNRLDQQS